MPDDTFGRMLYWTDRFLKPVELIFTFFGGALVFALMIIGMAQIILRNIFNAPIFGYVDIVEFGMVGFALLAISYVQREGIHVRMEILVGALKGRALWLVELLNTTLAVVIISILIPYTYQHFYRAYEFGDSTLDIELPTWPGKLVVPVALTLLLVRLLIQWFGYLRLVASPDAQPVAVPLIKSVEQAAEEEIEVTN
jgi:C4-dicarboxylate transporter DctQ subunit